MPRAVVALSLPFLLLCVIACSGRRIDTLQSLPLPREGIAPDAWQVLQTLRIDFDGQQMRLMAALVQRGSALTLVLLDPLGRRLLSVQKSSDEISSYRDPMLPAALPERFLLAVVQFVWWPPARWPALGDSHWSISQTGTTQRVLSYRSEPVLSARFAEPSPGAGDPSAIDLSDVGATVTLLHHRQPLSIVITTERWQQL